MPAFAPRIPRRLLDEIERLSKKRVPIAEINRLVGAEAARMGLPRPSYERVRLLVHDARRYRRTGPASVSTVAFEVAVRLRSPLALANRFGEGPQQHLRGRLTSHK